MVRVRLIGMWPISLRLGALALMLVLLAWGGGVMLLAQERKDGAEIMDTLKTARVTAIREKMRNTTQTGLVRLDKAALTAAPAVFGTPDVIKTLQRLPGVAAGNELMSGLYVHGGDGNDNLFLLDGIPLYNISHFGGLFSSFNTDVVDNLDFYKSGFPARYGGRMSSVVDVQTRQGDMLNYHGSVSLGLIDGRLQVEGPIIKGRTSFNFGLRRTWLDVVTVPLILYENMLNGDSRKVGGGYAMTDLNARLTHVFSPKSVLDITFYTGRDNLRASISEKDNVVDDAGLVHKGEDKMGFGVKWGSLTAGVAHQYNFTDKLKARTQVYYSQSDSDTGYSFDMWDWNGGDSYTKMDDNDRSYVREVGLTSNFDYTLGNFHRFRFGGSAQYHWYHSGRAFKSSSSSPVNGDRTSEDSEASSYQSFEPAVYAEDEMFLRYNLTLNVGLRAALFTTSEGAWGSIEPRVAMKWLINNNVSAKLSYTRMSQFAHLVAAMYMDLPSNSWMPSTASARPMVSDQIAGGIYMTPLQHLTLNLEGWYKSMDHILVYSGSNSFVPPLTEWEKAFSEGKGRSWGSELEVTYQTENLTLSAYYTLSWTNRHFEDFYFDWYRDRNDNRHKIDLVAQWRFGKGFSLFVDWNYHSGNRITFPTHVVGGPSGSERTFYVYDAPYNTKLPDYHRLDVGIGYQRTNRRGHKFKADLSVYNAYNHANASLAMLDVDRNGNFQGRAFALVPIIPTISFTYAF